MKVSCCSMEGDFLNLAEAPNLHNVSIFDNEHLQGAGSDWP